MNTNVKKALVGLVLVVVGALLFYFFYWTKTPAYSLNLLREAAQKHDIVLFEKHLDMDTFLNRAFDDAILYGEKSSGVSLSNNVIGAGIVKMLKEPMVDLMKGKVREAVNGVPQAKAQTNPTADRLAENMEKKLPTLAHLGDISVLSKDAGLAHVAVKLHDEQLDKDLTVKLKLAALEDGTWQVKEWTNMVECLQERDRLVEEKLAELNAEVREQLNQAVAFTDERTRVYSDHDPFFASYTLVNSFTMKNISDKKITSLVGEYTLSDPAQAITFAKKYSYENGLAVGEEFPASVSGKLNPFLGADSYIIDNYETVQGHNQLVAVTFADGTSLELLEELPQAEEK